MQVIQPFTRAAHIKPLINVGALFDIPSGSFLPGIHGEYILNGGLAHLTGFTAIGNAFKSTLMHFMTFTAAARMPKSFGSTYDTELNMQEARIRVIAGLIRDMGFTDMFDEERWVLTDKINYSGNKFYAVLKQLFADKKKNAKTYTVKTPFLDYAKTGNMTMLLPTFNQIDSFTEFDTDNVTKMQDGSELGDSSGNPIQLRAGLDKYRFLQEAGVQNVSANNYLLLTAQLGKESTMQNAGPAGSVPITKLKTLKNGDKMKGVTDKFSFLMHNCWHCYNTKAMGAKDGFGPFYPRDAHDRAQYDQDLQEVTVRQLRGKNGPSGVPITVIISQADGVQVELTELNFVRTQQKIFPGSFVGGDTNYAYAVYPSCSVSRTTVRAKFEEDARLRRAANLTSELSQMILLWRNMDDLLCTPAELYKDLTDMGYDWDVLLDTRGWWTYDNDKHPVPFLSTMDFLRMRSGEYIPYWFTAAQKAKIKVKNPSPTVARVLDDAKRCVEFTNSLWPTSTSTDSHFAYDNYEDVIPF